MQANWDRLDAGRFAARIAASLKVLADPAVVPMDDFHTSDMLTRLGSKVLGGPILAQLQTLQGHVAAGRWREAARLLRSANPVLRTVDSTLPQRLTNILYAAIVRKGNPAALCELAKVTDPLPIDPHWNRGLAMAWERLDDQYDEDETDDPVERYWRAYLDDLVQLECLLPPERPLAQAMVWHRLGQMLAEDSCPICATCGVRHQPDEDLQRWAIDCFENALKLSPEWLSAYQDLAEAYREWGDLEHAAATRRRLIERFPENLESLLFLTEHHIRRDEPFAAREFVFRAHRLKPLDAKIKAIVWSVHLSSARHHALAGRWDDGRAEFAAAEKLDCPHAEVFNLLVGRATFEMKAGDWGLANQLLDRARNELGEAAPLWLLTTITSRRYALPKAIADEFEHRWLTVLKKSRRSEAAGKMCGIMAAHLIMNVNYSDRDDHVAVLLDFLCDCKRIRKWRSVDLRNILDFLMAVDIQEEHEKRSKKSKTENTLELLADFATKARRKFPEVAFFQYLVGEMEMRKGPWECDRRLARKCFERVLQLAEGPDDPDYAQTAKSAREKLDLLDETMRSPFDAAPSFLPPDEENVDDEPFEHFNFGIGDDGRPAFSTADLPKDLLANLTQLCSKLGLDPLEVLNKVAGDEDAPFRFRAEDAPSSKQKRK
jgi:tetratricopeptide (TPR) repeat protein